MQLKFLFPKGQILDDNDANKCKIAQAICENMSRYMLLPDELTIEFTSMPNNVYGDSTLDNKSKKYIRLNSMLRVVDLMIPLVHELIHVNQMHEGKLMITHDGIFIWDTVPYEVNLNDIHYKDYQMLPWEVDVRQRQPKVLQELLKSCK
jgi:hypothetical protein